MSSPPKHLELRPLVVAALAVAGACFVHLNSVHGQRSDERATRLGANSAKLALASSARAYEQAPPVAAARTSTVRASGTVAVLSTVPACDGSLPRAGNNVVRLTFDGDLTAPGVGEVTVRELLDAGAFGADLSAAFSFTVELDAGTNPRVLKVAEIGNTLTHRRWYAIRNRGSWVGVAPLQVDYVVQVGDANADGRLLFADLSVANSHIPSFAVSKPTGHTCTP